MHLQSVEHKSVVSDNSLYAGVDKLIEGGTHLKDFLKTVEKKHSIKLETEDLV